MCVYLLIFEVIWFLFIFFSTHLVTKSLALPPTCLLIGCGFTYAPDLPPLPLCSGAAGGYHESVQVKTLHFVLYAHLAILEWSSDRCWHLTGEMSALWKNVPDYIISHLPRYVTFLLLLKSLSSVKQTLLWCLSLRLEEVQRRAAHPEEEEEKSGSSKARRSQSLQSVRTLSRWPTSSCLHNIWYICVIQRTFPKLLITSG